MPENGAAARTDPPARRTARRRPDVCKIRELGHEVRLSPVVHSRPYVKRQKNEKATRPVVEQAGALAAGWAACQRTGDLRLARTFDEHSVAEGSKVPDFRLQLGDSAGIVVEVKQFDPNPEDRKQHKEGGQAC